MGYPDTFLFPTFLLFPSPALTSEQEHAHARQRTQSCQASHRDRPIGFPIEPPRHYRPQTRSHSEGNSHERVCLARCAPCAECFRIGRCEVVNCSEDIGGEGREDEIESGT